MRPNSFLDRYGAFSQQLVAQDVSSIKALYMSNGFSAVKVTPKFTDSDTAAGKPSKISHFKIEYVIDEGTQRRIGKYDIEGATAEQLSDFRPYLNTQVGQPYSAVNINQDRNLVQTYYYSKGYDNAQVNLFQQTEPDQPGCRGFHHEHGGRQAVLRAQGHRLRPGTNQAVGGAAADPLNPGDPLNQTALLQMQRKLYDLALFNEVNTAIQNPNGDETYKNVLLNLTEAKRWDISYGFGFEVQTGAPSQNCLPADQVLLGIRQLQCNPNGHTGASPRILFNVSRTNLRGTDQSITLRTNYGTLEQIALLSYQDPHFLNKPSLNLTLSGGYNNSAVITTYRAAILSGATAPLAARHQTHHLDLLLVLPPGVVNADTLQVSLPEIPLWRNRCGWGGRE